MDTLLYVSSSPSLPNPHIFHLFHITASTPSTSLHLEFFDYRFLFIEPRALSPLAYSA